MFGRIISYSIIFIYISVLNEFLFCSCRGFQPIYLLLGMTFGQLAKYTSAMYSELAPAEKEALVQRAEADKARYLHELANYVPPAGYDSKGDAILSPLQKASGRKGKPQKDPNAPKRNMSAYLLYQNAMRDQFKRENPVRSAILVFFFLLLLLYFLSHNPFLMLLFLPFFNYPSKRA